MKRRKEASEWNASAHNDPAETASRPGDDRYRILYENLRDGCAAVDNTGRIVECNKQFLALFGYTFAEISRMTYEQITPSRWHALELDILRKQVEPRGYSDLYQKEYIHKDGSVFPVEIQTYLNKDSTDQKKLEEERRELDSRLHQTQRLESLGVLAGGIAHDFNNILMAILGHSELALDELSPVAPSRESIQNIRAAALSARELCAQMLAYSGKGGIEKQSICLSDLVDEMLHMLKTCIF